MVVNDTDVTYSEKRQYSIVPNNFKLESVSDNRQYRAIGNAVPPVLMWKCGKCLIQIIYLKKKNEQKKMIENLV